MSVSWVISIQLPKMAKVGIKFSISSCCMYLCDAGIETLLRELYKQDLSMAPPI